VEKAAMQAKPRSNPVVELMRLCTEVGKAFWTKRAAVYELAACDASELAGVAQDLGISAADLRILASRNKTAADLLNCRLGRVDKSDPDTNARQQHEGCKAFDELVVSGGDAA
jgi:hypothetical protein